jgi:hypothetical protein
VVVPDLEGEEVTVSSRQTTGLPTDVLVSNIKILNGVVWEAIVSGGLTTDAFVAGSVAVETLASTEPAGDGVHTVGELARMLFAYLYSCAMPAGEQLVLDLGGEQYLFHGGVGLAPEWGEPSGACDEGCQLWVSACVLARTNATGDRVEVSLRGNHPALQPSAEDLLAFPLREGSFYGNIFTGSLEQTYACAGPGSSLPGMTARFCSAVGDSCPISAVGDCVPATQCTSPACSSRTACANWTADGLPGTCFAQDYACHSGPPGAGYDHVITVYLRRPVPVCGNEICEAGEDPQQCAADCAGSWAHRFGSACHEDTAGLAVDGAGNILLAGRYVGDIDFGGQPLPSLGTGSAVFVAKLAADGSHRWSKGLATSLTTVTASVVDGQGNLYIAGRFAGPSDFGGGILTPAGEDLFVSKYDPAGHHQWDLQVRDESGLATSTAAQPTLAVNGGGEVIFAAHFSGTITTLAGSLVSSTSKPDIAVIKVSSAGTILWQQSFGMAGTETVAGVAASSAGDITLVGSFRGETRFAKDVRLVAASSTDVDSYVARLDAKGAARWAVRVGGVDAIPGVADVSLASIDVASEGVVVTGRFTGTVDVGVGHQLGPADRGYRGLLVRIADNGVVQWARAFGGTEFESEGNAVRWMPDGRVVVSGRFFSVAVFAGLTLSANSFGDIALFSYDGDGRELRARQFGGPVAELTDGLAAAAGHLVLSGRFMGTAQFSGTYLTNAGGSRADFAPMDIFVTRLAD